MDNYLSEAMQYQAKHTDEIFKRLRPRYDYWQNEYNFLRYTRNFVGNYRQVVEINFSWWDYDGSNWYVVRIIDPETGQVTRYRKIKRQPINGFRQQVILIEAKGGGSNEPKTEEPGG